MAEACLLSRPGWRGGLLCVILPAVDTQAAFPAPDADVSVLRSWADEHLVADVLACCEANALGLPFVLFLNVQSGAFLRFSSSSLPIQMKLGCIYYTGYPACVILPGSRNVSVSMYSLFGKLFGADAPFLKRAGALTCCKQMLSDLIHMCLSWRGKITEHYADISLGLALIWRVQQGRGL